MWWPIWRACIEAVPQEGGRFDGIPSRAHLPREFTYHKRVWLSKLPTHDVCRLCDQSGRQTRIYFDFMATKCRWRPCRPVSLMRTSRRYDALEVELVVTTRTAAELMGRVWHILHTSKNHGPTHFLRTHSRFRCSCSVFERTGYYSSAVPPLQSSAQFSRRRLLFFEVFM